MGLGSKLFRERVTLPPNLISKWEEGMIAKI